MKIIVDTLGSDKGVLSVVEGVKQSIDALKIECVLVGPKNEIESFLEYDSIKSKVEIIDTDEVILNNEEPTLAVRRKKNASINLGMRMLDEEKADGLISFGSTGGVLVSGLFIVKRMENVERAALTINLPTNKGRMVLLDVGANIECTVNILEKFAIMGNVYAKEVLNIEKPRVALLNIGAEEGKGTKILKELFTILKENEDINFVGNIEARDIFDGDIDVLVCDGFHGNLVLKTVEGASKFIMENMKKSMLSSLQGKIGALLVKGPLKKFKKMLDYREYGACPMLGLNKPVFKGHGSSDSKAVFSGIASLVEYIEKDINFKIKNVMENRKED